MSTRRETDKDEDVKDWTPQRGIARLKSEPSGWIKFLVAPAISALITGLAMYVAIRVEVAQLSVRQEMTLRSLDELRKGIDSQANQMASVRERLAALETVVKK